MPKYEQDQADEDVKDQGENNEHGLSKRQEKSSDEQSGLQRATERDNGTQAQ